MVFWHGPRVSRRNCQVNPWRCNPENNVLACLGVFKRLSSKEAGPMKRELGGRVYSNIDDDSWVTLVLLLLLRPPSLNLAPWSSAPLPP
eukprot:9492134-Pyramimonas_sp.AAC.1